MPATLRGLVNAKRFFMLRIGPTAGALVCVGAVILFSAQEPTTSPSGLAAIVKDSRFATPEATIRNFRNAVKHRRWRDEYECYTSKPQARFTYHIMVSTLEMSDSEDLAAKMERKFQKYRIPKGLLDRFPSLRLNLSDLDPRHQEMALKEHGRKYQLQSEIWEHEVQPLVIDWSGLIDELQPLFIENFHRHEGSFHPSQSGIVHHLDCYLFDRVWDLQTDHDLSEGTIVARIRDPNASIEGEGVPGIWSIMPWKSSALNWKSVLSIDAWQGRAGKPARKISLVRQTDGWKIDEVPGR